jgi:hypothetical protein
MYVDESTSPTYPSASIYAALAAAKAIQKIANARKTQLGKRDLIACL